MNETWLEAIDSLLSRWYFSWVVRMTWKSSFVLRCPCPRPGRAASLVAGLANTSSWRNRPRWCSVFSVVTLVNISTPGPGPSIVWSTCQHVTQPRSPPASVPWPCCQVQRPAACCVPPLSFLASIKMLQISFMIHSAVRMSGKSCAGQRPSETRGGKNLGR